MDLTDEGRKKRIPDILDAIAALSSDAVPTPPELARAMLDLLPAEVWTNPNFKWLDPAVKSGSILREIASRLMVGLEDWQPDRHKRAEHIMTNMLHGLSITKLHAEMGRRSVYRSKDATSEKAVGKGDFFESSEGNIRFVHAEHQFKKSQRGLDTGNCEICGAPIGLERGVDRENYAYSFIHDESVMERLKGMKFDVVVGNPPYQVGDLKNEDDRAAPIYNRFIDGAIALEPKYLAMIVPSRWFTGGWGLDKFRARMLNERRFSAIVDNPKVYDCFPGVKIRGGVNFFLWDRDHDGDCEFTTRVDGQVLSVATRDLRLGDGVLVRDNMAASVLEKVRRAHFGLWGDSVCGPQMPFGGMRTNFDGDHPDKREGDVAVVLGTRAGYTSPDNIDKNAQWIDTWKVLLPMASSGDTNQDESGRIVDVVLGEPIALAPGSACTQTYLIAGMFQSRVETENFANYLATKFVRFLVLQRKTTQHIYSDRFRFVPALDMNRPWTDEDLYAEFGLNKSEVEHIEASIRPRSVNLSLDSALPSSHLPGGRKYRAPNQHASDTLGNAAVDE